MSWTRLTRGQCPICNGGRKDCRQSEQTSFIHCRESTANPPGFKFIGEDALGFGMWQSQEEADEQAKKSREQWELEKRLERQARERQDKERFAKFLTPAERHLEIQKIIKQLSLSEKDREILLSRPGMSSEIIEHYKYRSLPVAWQPLSTPVSSRLAGTNYKGNKLNNPTPGILSPIVDVEGYYVGLRVYNPSKKEHGKYYPLSSPSRGFTAHLPNREQPIAVRVPAGCTDGSIVGVCEGGEIKSVIAAEKMGIPMLGFPGSNWACSPKTLKESLETLGAKQIILYPDAGTPVNPQIKHQKAINLLVGWGYDVQVAWWGQIQKEVGDIDEISNLDQINLISPSDFLAICHEWRTKPDRREERPILKTFQRATKEARELWDRLTQIGEQKKEEDQKIVWYVPGKEIEIKPGYTIKFRAGERESLYRQLVSQGQTHILDKSATGTHKTTTAGAVRFDSEEIKSYWYISPDHRNEPTATLTYDEGGWVDVPARHQGLYLDDSRRTAGGRPYRMTTEIEGAELTESNCINANAINTLAGDKGYFHDNLKEVCHRCPFFAKCKKSRGDGYGFLLSRGIALGAPRKRIHPNSLPNPKEAKYDEGVGFWEEASHAIDSTKRVAGTWDDDLLKQFYYLRKTSPDAAKLAEPLEDSLEKLLKIKVTERYGIEHEKVMEVLGDIRDKISEQDWLIIRDATKELLDTDKAFPEFDSVEGGGDRINSYFSQKEQLEAIQSQPSNLLPYLVEIIGLGRWGDIRLVSTGKLRVTVSEQRYSEITGKFKANFYLDATANEPQLCGNLGINREQLVVIEQETPDLTNLNIQFLVMPGLKSNQRSQEDSIGQRLGELVKKIQTLHPKEEIPVLGIKADGVPYIWGRDNRSQNQLAGKEQFIILGEPKPNLGEVKAQYRSLHGSVEGFEEYYNNLIENEKIQAIGRLRAHLYPGKKFTIYWATSNPSTESFQGMGCHINARSIENFCEEAAPNTLVRLKQIKEAIAEGARKGLKITQQEIADLLKMSQSEVSRILKSAGVKWKQFVKDFLDSGELFKPQQKAGSMIEEVVNNAWRRWYEVAPATIVSQVLEQIEKGKESILEVLGWLEPEVRWTIIGLMFSYFGRCSQIP